MNDVQGKRIEKAKELLIQAIMEIAPVASVRDEADGYGIWLVEPGGHVCSAEYAFDEHAKTLHDLPVDILAAILVDGSSEECLKFSLATLDDHVPEDFSSPELARAILPALHEKAKKAPKPLGTSETKTMTSMVSNAIMAR